MSLLLLLRLLYVGSNGSNGSRWMYFKAQAGYRKGKTSVSVSFFCITSSRCFPLKDIWSTFFVLILGFEDREKSKLCPFIRRLKSSMCLFYAQQNLSMYAAVRAPVPGVKCYWHNKGMFIHRGDESADVSVICDDNLIELPAYWRDKKETLLIKTSRLGYRQGWGPTGPVSVDSSAPTSYVEVSSSPPDDKRNSETLQRCVSYFTKQYNHLNTELSLFHC